MHYAAEHDQHRSHAMSVMNCLSESDQTGIKVCKLQDIGKSGRSQHQMTNSNDVVFVNYGICYSAWNNPHSLPCGHIFSKHCIDNLQRTNLPHYTSQFTTGKAAKLIFFDALMQLVEPSSKSCPFHHPTAMVSEKSHSNNGPIQIHGIKICIHLNYKHIIQAAVCFNCRQQL